MPVKEKQKQIRYTLEDCLFNQRKLSVLVQQLIRDNRPLDMKEKLRYYELLPKSLLSQGATDPVSIVIQKGWFTFASIQSLAMRLADLTSDKVSLKTSRPEEVEITVPISELWSFLYDKLLYLFPLSAAEAVHLSGENIPRAEQGVYSFSSSQKLEERR
ncbi:MAG: hypothetical protein JSW60_07370 [Thermoplasmatales archaeon]|nr:MAG: hypothetical protein JSW60_07370 [Thermoplasmatales archaeon]